MARQASTRDFINISMRRTSGCLSIETSASPVSASRPCLRSRAQASAEAGFVHHDEHVLKAAIGFAEQVTDGTAAECPLIAVGHHAGRAGVDAKLVFNRHAVGVVARAERTVGID